MVIKDRSRSIKRKTDRKKKSKHYKIKNEETREKEKHKEIKGFENRKK